MKKSKLSLILFIGVSILYVFGILIDNISLRFIFKPLILVSLMIYYSSSVQEKSQLFLAALFFSFLGDIFLLFESEINFILGLVSFLLAHIMFIVLVVRMLKKPSSKNGLIAFIPFVITFSGLLFLLKDSLGEMMIPVIIYGAVISIFGTVSLLNYLTSKTKESMFLLIGAVFFVLSDSVLAINKFYDSMAFYPLIVIVTYILAQYFICLLYTSPSPRD